MRSLLCALFLVSVVSGCHCIAGVCDCDLDPDPCCNRAPWVQNAAAPFAGQPLPANVMPGNALPELTPVPKKN